MVWVMYPPRLRPRLPTARPVGPPASRGHLPCRRGRLRRRLGFTLTEAALATVIVGVGISGLMTLAAALTEQNATAGRMSTALLLASNVQEAMEGLSFNDPAYAGTYFGPEPGETLASFNDIDDFDGQTLSPPIDAARQPIAALGQYTQVVSVVPVYGNKLNSNLNAALPELPKTAYTGAVRVTVKVLYKRVPTATGQEVYRASWIRTAQ